MAGAGAGAGLILGIQFFNNGITLVLSINLPTCVFREFPEHTTVTTLVLQTILQFHNRFSQSLLKDTIFDPTTHNK